MNLSSQAIIAALSTLNGISIALFRTVLGAEGPTFAEILTGIATAIVSIMGGYGLLLKVRADAKKVNLEAETKVKERNAEIDRKNKELELKIKQVEDQSEEKVRLLMMKNYEKVAAMSEDSIKRLSTQVLQNKESIDSLTKDLELVKKENAEQKSSIELLVRDNYELRKHIIKMIQTLEDYLNTLPVKDPTIVAVLEEASKVLARNWRPRTEE